MTSINTTFNYFPLTPDPGSKKGVPKTHKDTSSGGAHVPQQNNESLTDPPLPDVIKGWMNQHISTAQALSFLSDVLTTESFSSNKMKSLAELLEASIKKASAESLKEQVKGERKSATTKMIGSIIFKFNSKSSFFIYII